MHTKKRRTVTQFHTLRAVLDTSPGPRSLRSRSRSTAVNARVDAEALATFPAGHYTELEEMSYVSPRQSATRRVRHLQVHMEHQKTLEAISSGEIKPVIEGIGHLK